MNRLQGMKIAASLVTACMGVGAASAGGMNVPKIDHAPTLKECGACHMVYSPQMLPQRSWEAMMSNLDNHFGDNAQLDEPTRADVLGYLLANAADAPGQSRYKWLLRGIKPSVVPVRITEMQWWVRGHGEVNVGNLKATKIKSASNCLGCHGGADKSGYFGE